MKRSRAHLRAAVTRKGMGLVRGCYNGNGIGVRWNEKGKDRWEGWVVDGRQPKAKEVEAWANKGKEVVADGSVQDDCRAGRVTVTTGACPDRQPDCENSGHARVSTKLQTNRLKTELPRDGPIIVTSLLLLQCNLHLLSSL